MRKLKFPSSLTDLKSLIIGRDSIRTSDGNLFGGVKDIWARDRAITGEDLIDIRPKIAKKAIIELAQLQGTKTNINSGEKPGRIHTEHREIYNNKKLGLLTKFGLSFASGVLWRTGWTTYTNYYSSDTTPFFIRLVYQYVKKDPDFINYEYINKDGSLKTIKQSIILATEYIESIVSADGLIRIKENNIAGNQFRYWRDSPNSFRDEYSILPNISEAMVILDIQFLCAEALENASKLIATDQALVKKWHEIAEKIRQATINNLWMEDEQYFAYGMDLDIKGNLKKLKSIQSNAGWMLNSDFFEHINDFDKRKYITGIIKKIFSDEMLTDAGVRCRSKKYMYDRDFHTYHGSWVTWPVDSYMIAKGLRRQGFYKLADQIEIRFINAVNMSGNNYEFFIVDRLGRVLLNPNKKKTANAEVLPIEMKPEKTIAWTVTATLRAKKERRIRQLAKNKDKFYKKQQNWVNELESETLKNIKIHKIYKSNRRTKKHIYPQPNIYIDQKTGFFRSSVDLFKKIGIKTLKQAVRNIFKKSNN